MVVSKTNAGLRWRRGHFFDLRLLVVLVRGGRSGSTPWLVSLGRLRCHGGPGRLPELADPSPLRRRHGVAGEGKKGKSFKKKFK